MKLKTSPGFLVSQCVARIIGDIAKTFTEGGVWEVESITKYHDNRRVIIYACGPRYSMDESDIRERIHIEVYLDNEYEGTK